MKKTIFLLLAATVGFSACKKADADTTASPTPTTFSEIKASSGFDWSSEKKITVSIKGMPTIEPVTDKLVISSGSGAELLSQSYTMSDNQDIVVTLPASETTVTMQFGSIKKSVAVASAVSFDFLPEVTNDYNPNN